jgi:hypothetical protein
MVLCTVAITAAQGPDSKQLRLTSEHHWYSRELKVSVKRARRYVTPTTVDWPGTAGSDEGPGRPLLPGSACSRGLSFHRARTASR